ncbi:MAG: hypothetical protein IPN71_05730 [Fibrobacteres bacterium]|nr:hypothetical protein [Fibrobacterota bacterium]
MVQVTPQEVPKAWRPTVDLFEVGFLYVFLPLVVSTMDRPPHFLGGKILLWMVAWFFLRRMAEFPNGQDRTSKLVRSALGSLVGAGIIAAGMTWAGQMELGEAARSLLNLALVVLPACALVFLYLPARLSGSEWITPGLRPALPALAFAGLHLTSGTWQAPLLALAGGYAAALLRFPLWVCVLGQWSIAMAGARWLW